MINGSSVLIEGQLAKIEFPFMNRRVPMTLMGTCSASYSLDHSDTDPWPSGNWHLCTNEATKVRFVPITPDCLVLVQLCDAHWESWELRGEAIRGLLGV